MSTNLHQLLILPGSNVNIFCKDGLSSLDVDNVKKIFNFGGNIQMKNCGPQNEWEAINQSMDDMGVEYFAIRDGSNTTKIQDFKTAFNANEENAWKYSQPPNYQNWVASFRSNAEMEETMF